MQKTVLRCVRIAIIATLILNGYMQTTGESTAFASSVATENAKKKGPVYKGRVVGKSNKAKTISIQVGKGVKAQTLMLSFDEKSEGIEHATKGHGVIVSYEKRGKTIYAKSIKPKLAKLPKGVSQIRTAELKELVNNGADIVLVDSRPAARYSQSHLPGAISIPVCEMQELIGLLPKNKNAELIFYCGGPT